MNALTPKDVASCCKRAYDIREASFDKSLWERLPPQLADRRCYTVSYDDAVDRAMKECRLHADWRGLIYAMVTSGYCEPSDWWNRILGGGRAMVEAAQ